MIRILLVGFQLLFFSLFSWMDGGKPMVEQELPQALPMNQSSLVKVSIQKDKVEGFAQLELNVPDGYAVAAVDTKGASFTFSKNKARFVWMNLPSEPQFSISYRVTHVGNESKSLDLNGDFSFIQNNKKRSVAIHNKVVANPVFQEVVTEEGKIVSSKLNSSEDVPSCERLISKVGDDIVVDLIVQLNGMKGFLKVQDWVGDGCVVEKGQTAGATVTVDKGSIKFVWFEVPGVETMAVRYKVKCNSIPEDGLHINGKLSFVLNNRPREIPVIQGKINLGEGQSVAQTASVPNDTLVPVVTTPIAEVKPEPIAEVKPEVKVELAQVQPLVTPPVTGVTPAVTEPVASQKSEINEIPIRNAKTEIAAEASVANPVQSEKGSFSGGKGVRYRVQIMANHRSISTGEWSKSYSFEEKAVVENHEGWMKWTTGDFDTYETARSKREQLKITSPKLPGPFVTAYLDGNRISVQEALTITHQKWVQ
jgi:hypothetical protein